MAEATLNHLPPHCSHAGSNPPQMASRRSPEVALQQVADSTEGYSGSDVFLVAKEAAMRPLRRLMARLETGASEGDPQQPSQGSEDRDRPAGRKHSGNPAGGAAGDRAVPGSSGSRAAAVATGPVVVGPIESEDLKEALLVTKASARQYEKKYAQFSQDYGQLGS